LETETLATDQHSADRYPEVGVWVDMVIEALEVHLRQVTLVGTLAARVRELINITIMPNCQYDIHNEGRIAARFASGQSKSLSRQ